MLVRDMSGERDDGTARVRAADLVHGALRLEEGRDGFTRPWRFSDQQFRAFGSCQSWHPGLYRQMARTTAGVCLEFVTDSSAVTLEVELDREPQGTREVLACMDREGQHLPHDGVSCEVDGRMLGARLPDASGLVTFLVDDPEEAPAEGMVQLPGMGVERQVRLWLPALRGCRVRQLVGNGTFIRPVPARPQLLVFGDSIAQGFVTEDPGLSWPACLARQLGLDLVNQGLGGAVFQPGTMLGVAAATDPDRIVVALGANYRYEPCRRRLVTVDIRSYLLEVSRIWPHVPTWVLTPLWHDEGAWPSNGLSCWREVPTFLRAHTAPHDQMTLVDGLDLLDHQPSLMADGFEHPDAEGADQVAHRLAVVMASRRGSDADRRDRALAALAGAPRQAVALEEAVRRGLGDVVFAEGGCVLLELPDGQLMLWGEKSDRSRDVIRTLVKGQVVDCLAPGLVGDVAKDCGLPVVEPYHLCVYEGEGRTGRRRARPLDEFVAGRDIRVLDRSYLRVVRERYSFPRFTSDAEVARLLAGGLVLGGFEGDDLVGFVAEHPEGSIGMLGVFPEWQGRGWGLALEAAKAKAELDLGHVPWCEVYPDNKASLHMQRKLGFTILPAERTCFLSREGE